MNLFKSKVIKIEELTQHIADVEAQYEALKLENDKLVEENKTLAQQLTEAISANATLEETIEDNQEVLEVITEEVKEIIEEKETIDEVAASKAIEILNSVSQPTVDIVEDESTEALEQGEQVSVIERLKGLTGKELNEYFLANKDQIFKALKG